MTPDFDAIRARHVGLHLCADDLPSGEVVLTMMDRCDFIQVDDAYRRLVEAVEYGPGVDIVAPHVPNGFEHDESCAYAYGNLTYPCRCLIARSALRAALAESESR